ncbi:chromosome-associated kinesin KIF4B [Lepeophtheirus salmonis]|uniref:chromosome-associated kinesin KIF4B n=1 Tax=Lepeophtheirus salmonis TaxID=72036 RepID=UPI001AE7CF04|nr:chromosome-associated kinesin KIF4B-like [Lepeophtheirus salmonis]
MTYLCGTIPVQVAACFFPLNENKLTKSFEDAIEVLEENQIYIKSTKNTFTYDFAFGNHMEEEEVYNKLVKELIPQLFKGCNIIVPAYEETGSGKTHSTRKTNSQFISPELLRIISIAIKDIFEHISQEACADVKRKEKCSLDIQEDHKNELYISNLLKVPEDAVIQFENGSKKIVTAATAMNNVSSRSLTIFTFHIEVTNMNKDFLVFKFHLVELAMPERHKKTKTTVEILKEGIDINKGILAFGNVIIALGEGTYPSGYKHTRLLQNSIGENSHTLMTDYSSNSDLNLDGAKQITNNREGKEIDELKNEIVNLKTHLDGRVNESTDLLDKEYEYADLQDSINELKTENKELS